MIESNGATSLTAVGSNFYLYDSTGAGPSLKYNGASLCGRSVQRLVTDLRREDGERLPGRLEGGGADQYSIWTTDSNGNYISSTDVARAAAAAVISAETVLQQDLNSDGTIGTVHASPPPPPPPPSGTVIEFERRDQPDRGRQQFLSL